MTTTSGPGEATEPTDELRDQIVRVIYGKLAGHPMWIDGRNRGLGYSSERDIRIGDFLNTVADDLLTGVVAPLLTKLQAAKALAEEAERFADEDEARYPDSRWVDAVAATRRIYARAIRRALDA